MSKPLTTPSPFRSPAQIWEPGSASRALTRPEMSDSVTNPSALKSPMTTPSCQLRDDDVPQAPALSATMETVKGEPTATGLGQVTTPVDGSMVIPAGPAISDQFRGATPPIVVGAGDV